MATIIDNPDPLLKAKWGPLAHVTEAERKRILSLSFGLFKPAVKAIEKQLKDIEKKKKASNKENALKAARRLPPQGQPSRDRDNAK